MPAGERQPGQTVQDVIAAHTRQFAAYRGVDLDWADTDRVTRLHQYNVFPNMTFLANADHLTLMCSRPGPDPDKGELVMFSMARMPPGAARNKPTDVRMSAGKPNPVWCLPRTSGCCQDCSAACTNPGSPTWSSPARSAG